LVRKNKPSQQAFAVVTGAGSGIGRSFALELAKRGGTVVCSDINLDAAKETVALIEAQGERPLRCNVMLRKKSRLINWLSKLNN
jgi:NAD(P)-dependent dehydrogenase (short-subunit alcohol dehydrogenase family)